MKQNCIYEEVHPESFRSVKKLQITGYQSASPSITKCNKRAHVESEVLTDRSTKKLCMISEWASLPKDILFMIMDKLFEPLDHVCLGAICKHWHSVSREYNHKTQRWSKVLPMLMIPSFDTKKRTVYSFSEDKAYKNVQFSVHFEGCWCRGSSHGWLAIVEKPFVITLLSPFKKEPFPPLPLLTPKEFFLEYVHKVILSPDCDVVVAIYDHGRLAFIKVGQENWTYIEGCMFSDAIFYRGKIYAVRFGGQIMSLDYVNCSTDPSMPPKPILLTPLGGCPLAHRVFPSKANLEYLVESTNGDLLHIRKFLKRKEGQVLQEPYNIDGFVVYKALFEESNGSIVKRIVVDSIGDDALFVGDSYSMSVLASNFPNCQRDSIYFTGNPRKGNSGMGVYNLKDKTITNLFKRNIPGTISIPGSLWVVPQFKFKGL